MGKKNLKINAAICDMRGASEESLSAYDKINVNASAVLVSETSNKLLQRHGVEIAAANVIELPDDVDAELQMINGKHTLGEGPDDGKKRLLMVNGVLMILPGAGETLKNMAAIIINGKAYCPKSLTAALSGATVNGVVQYYPDEAVVLTGGRVIDRVFALRAKDSLYWTDGSFIFTDEKLNAEMLVSKNARFDCARAVIADGYLETLIGQISETADVVIVPDGTRYVEGEQTLTDALLRRYGTKLHVDGDLTLNADSAGALEKLEYLYVNGDVSIPQSLADAFCRLDAVYNELKIVKIAGGGLEICDRLIVNITAEMLKRCPDGLLVSDCAKVVLAEDAEPDMIQERLRIDDVAKVVCTPEQRIAVELVCGDVSLISDGGAAAGRDDYGSEYDEYYSDYDYDHESGAGRGGNTVEINAASYKM